MHDYKILALNILKKDHAATAPYVFTKPLLLSQKHTWLENGELEIRISVIPNYELESVILSFGKNAEVLAPEWLRKKLSPHHS